MNKKIIEDISDQELLELYMAAEKFTKYLEEQLESENNDWWL